MLDEKLEKHLLMVNETMLDHLNNFSMLKKIYRLNEKELKKVLWNTKPFFSYWIVLNKKKNKLNHNRFWIVISKKSVNNNVERVFFRRLFYNLVNDVVLLGDGSFYDMVFVVKKHNKLDKNDKTNITSFSSDISFLVKKSLK